jgi:hypothetical protein
VGAKLQAVHDGMPDEPLPEGLDSASCDPAVKHLAHLALHTAAANGTEADWKDWVRQNVPEASGTVLAEAVSCMHESGLWPWPG